MNSIGCWCTIGIPNSNSGIKITKLDIYISRLFRIYSHHCRLTYSHVAIFANQTDQMFPQKWDRRSKIVRSVCEQHTNHWLLSKIIHILASQRQRQTIPMGRSLPIMTQTPQLRIKSMTILPFLCHTFLAVRKLNDARGRTNAAIYTGVSHVSLERLICRMQYQLIRN